jgi:nucleotide-binding universal stress UspA family protein
MLQYISDVDIEQIDAPTALAGLTALHQRRKIDVTVIASHTRQGAGRLIVGSVADGLVREHAALVLVVPPLADIAKDSMPLLTRVLVPLDGSGLAERALAPVLGWLGAKLPSELAPRHLMLLTVASAPWVLEHALHYLQTLREVLTSALPSVEITAHVRLGAAAEEIVAAADGALISRAGTSMRPDLVIMGTHGRGGLGRWLYGSVAGHVLPRTRVPVLLTHP